MRIQFIHPPVFLNVRSLTALRPSPPLGLAAIAAAARQAGHEVQILDALAEGVDQIVPDGRLHRLGLSVEQIVERVDPEVEVLGISNMWSFSWPLVRELIHQLRRRFPRTPLIAGGEHFTGLAEKSLRESPLDVIVAGEGEDTLIELLAALELGTPLDEVDGLVFLREGEVVRTAARARRRDLDSLPWPAWDLLDLQAYNFHALLPGLRSGFTVPILATRGCPYQCSYCSSPSMWTTRWEARDPVRVVDEIEHYVQHHGARNFPFQDLTAILRRDWIVAFCRELLRRELNIRWQLPSGTRCEVIDDEVASLLAQTGGRHLAFAPESGSEETRRRIRKRMRTDKLMPAVRAAVRHDLSLTAFLVLGFPDDRVVDLRASAGMARRFAWMGMTDIAVGYFFPIPNTEFFHRLVEEGRIVVDDEFLKTPIYANDPFLSRRNNYCREVGALRISLTKHWIVANFYAVSFLRRPWRMLRILRNVWRGEETSKLETFLIELRRKATIWWRHPWVKRPRSKGQGVNPDGSGGVPVSTDPARDAAAATPRARGEPRPRLPAHR